LCSRYRILEIDDDAIGARLGCLGEAVWPVRRHHEQDRATVVEYLL
jgi:hypothetical protein